MVAGDPGAAPRYGLGPDGPAPFLTRFRLPRSPRTRGKWRQAKTRHGSRSSAESLARIRGVLDQPHGLFLLTGPTGSGKTTTLYAALSYLNSPTRKICTVEDPIEFDLDGVSQTQVSTATGLDFATALRAILRQDPNVLMIGEIRDPETATIACRAALVGRLVLSTLHVNRPEEASVRLRDLGVEPYIIQSVLRGAMGQYLVPVPCGTCNGEGCASCGHSGIRARRLHYSLPELA